MDDHIISILITLKKIGNLILGYKVGNNNVEMLYLYKMGRKCSYYFNLNDALCQYLTVWHQIYLIKFFVYMSSEQ